MRNHQTTQAAPESKKLRKSLVGHLDVIVFNENANTQAAIARVGISNMSQDTPDRIRIMPGVKYTGTKPAIFFSVLKYPSQPALLVTNIARVIAKGKPKHRMGHLRSAYFPSAVFARYHLSKDSEVTRPVSDIW